jgi:hypothetical protein
VPAFGLLGLPRLFHEAIVVVVIGIFILDEINCSCFIIFLFLKRNGLSKDISSIGGSAGEGDTDADGEGDGETEGETLALALALAE